MGSAASSEAVTDSSLVPTTMAPMKKAMKAKAGKVMTKGALVKTLAEQHELKTKVCSGLLESLATLATTEVKKNGIFTIPGLARIKTRVKPATKAGVRMAFSQDSCEGLPSCRTQVADLSGSLACLLAASIPETCLPWESHGPGLGAQLLCRWRMCQ